MSIASRGAPLTSTASLKLSVTRIVSPSAYPPSPPGTEETATKVTVGAGACA